MEQSNTENDLVIQLAKKISDIAMITRNRHWTVVRLLNRNQCAIFLYGLLYPLIQMPMSQNWYFLLRFPC